MRYPITTYKRSLNRDGVQLTVDVEALSRLREVFLIVMISVSVLCCIALYEYVPIVNTGVAYAILISFGGLRYVAASLFGYIGITLYLHWNRLSESDTVLIFKLFGIALVFL